MFCPQRNNKYQPPYNRMEDCSIEVKGEVQQIFKVLSKEDQEKMPFEGIQIAKTLARIPFFQRFFDTNSQHFINLCIGETVREYQKGTDVYQRQSMEGIQRYLYVILSGGVTLSSSGNQGRSLGMLKIFGQLEMVFSLKERRQSAICNADCKMMIIRESALLKIFSHEDQLRRCLHFLDVNPYFQRLDELEKMQMTLGLTKRGFERGQILKVENEGMENVLFFIYGKAQVMVKLPVHKDQFYVIDQLQEMSIFGDYECASKSATNVTVRGCITGGYYLMSYSEMENEHHKIIRLLQEEACPYPCTSSLMFLQNVKSTLKKEEKRVLKQIR